MFNSFMSVNQNRNIVLLSVNSISKEQLLYILSQYFQFPRNIVSVLVSATYTFGYHGWTEVVNELRQNVFEELGGGCGEIASEFGPHYSIVRKEVENIFGLDIDECSPSPATIRFIESMRGAAQSEPWRTAGAVFALEASAVPELGIVLGLVKHLARVHRKPLSQNLLNFFKFHMKDIEVGHRDRLITLLENQLVDSLHHAKFLEGFDALLGSMDEWWIGLSEEAKAS
jgi:hypothetical protein